MLGEYSFKIDSLTISGPQPVHSDALTTIFLLGKITKTIDNLNSNRFDYASLIKEYYQKYGDLFYQYLDGHFLILIHDKKNNKLKIFNNRYQTTTLYYYQTECSLLFSDRLTNLVESDKIPIHINKGSVLSFISNGFTSTDQTQIDGILKLLPSFSLIAGNKGVELFNHWKNELKFERKPFPDLEEHLNLYEKIYKDGIKNYLNHYKTNELGSLLSGGHDTSFTIIQASKVHSRPIHCFTATFPGWSFDEGLYAENIAKKFNGIYHPVPFTSDDLDYMVGLIRTNEEPVVGSSLPLHNIARVASEKVDTMLAGDGGDTLWAEYHPVAEFHKYIQHLPLVGRKAIHQAAKGLRNITDWERFWELEHVSSLFAKKDCYLGFMRKLCTYRHFSDEFQEQLFNNDFYANSTPSSSTLEIEFNKRNFQESLIEGKLFNAFYTYQSFHTTKSMEYFGMNFYMPTINREVINFVTSLPHSYVNGGSTLSRLTNSKKENRKFHKLALNRHLDTKEIYNRSFDIPWYNILKPREDVLELLKNRLIRRGWFQRKTIEHIFSEFMKQTAKEHELLELKHHGYRIFTLLSLEIWCIEYLDKRLTKNFNQKIPLEDYLETT